jgi:hypothetical protein
VSKVRPAAVVVCPDGPSAAAAAAWVAEQAFAPLEELTEAFVQALRVGPVAVPVVDNCAPARLRSAASRQAVVREVVQASARVGAGPVPVVLRYRLAEGPRGQVALRASSPVVADFHCRVDSLAAAFRAPHLRPVVVSMSVPSRVQRVLRRDLYWSKSFFPARQPSPFRVRGF